MKHAATKSVLLVLLISVVQASGQSALRTFPQRPNSMSVWQARRTIAAQPKDAFWDDLEVDRSSYHFAPDSFEFDALSSGRPGHFKVDLRSPEVAVLMCWVRKNGELFSCSAGRFAVLPTDTGHKRKARSAWIRFAQNGVCLDDCFHKAESFVSAVNRLRAFAVRDTGTARTSFPQQAADWRALTTKPPIPEEVRIQRLLAEDAVKQNNPREALNCYEVGLETYPTWPQGYFNAALIAAELGFYADATEHMQSYLELLPDAPDAQSARDQIVIWKHKAAEGTP